MDQDEAIQFLRKETEKHQHQQKLLDNLTAHSPVKHSGLAFEDPRGGPNATFAGGEPPPYDCTPVVILIVVVLLIGLLRFWRSIGRCVDAGAIAGLAWMLRGIRKAKGAAARVKSRVIEKADQP